MFQAFELQKLLQIWQKNLLILNIILLFFKSAIRGCIKFVFFLLIQQSGHAVPRRSPSLSFPGQTHFFPTRVSIFHKMPNKIPIFIVDIILILELISLLKTDDDDDADSHYTYFFPSMKIKLRKISMTK